jgi:lipopolysaccharide biosynthesis glycosyltransferase
MIHCAICFHESGSLYKTVYCALLSCFEHSSEPIHIHALIDESVNPYKNIFIELCNQYKCKITFYNNIKIPNDIIELFPNQKVGQYTNASLFRMCIHEYVPIDVEKIIYFDCDVIFERDITDLWKINPENTWIVAAHDDERIWSKNKKKYYLNALHINEKRYFNSGVLLLNLKALREASKNGNVFWKAYHQCSKLFPILKFTVFDQDLLNYMLSSDHEKLKLIDSSFNYELCLFDRRFMRLNDLKGKILHFPALKPWEKLFPAQLVYWKYFIKSPWRDETIPMIEARIFDKKDRIWPILLLIWKKHLAFRWLTKLMGSR